ncbi:unnamed protein product [Schistosoma mattheei]|uniref:Uncharacterized protein n=1 Tax=Schistosoma mattheei TaxID=31246 RepID=A0A183NHP6_9TREM|nr:unnamed protein product [Schistosoma mattheei]
MQPDIEGFSPNYEVNEVLLDSLDTWSQLGRYLILEDFDTLMVDWKNLRTELSKNSFEQELADAVITCAPVQHVKEANRYDRNSETSLLDLILTHNGDDVTNLDYMLPLGKSDHAVLIFDFHIGFINEHVSAQPRSNVWKANIQDMIHSTDEVD